MDTGSEGYNLVMILVVTRSLDSWKALIWVLRINCKSLGGGGGKNSTNFQRGMVYGMTLNFHMNNIIGLIWPQCMEIMGRQIWGQYKQELSDGRSFAKVG